MKILVVFALICFCWFSECYSEPTGNYVQRIIDPNKFNLGEIPFGQTYGKVVDTLYGADVKIDDSASIPEIKSYNINKLFKNGIYTVTWLGDYSDYYFRPEIVKKALVEFGGWDNIKRINLYFYGDGPIENMKLFFVVKELRSGGNGTCNAILDSFADKIAKTLKVNAKSINTTFAYDKRPGSELYAASGKVWSTNKQNVILLGHEFFGACWPSIIYYSVQDWNSYIDISKKIDQNIENENKKSATNKSKDI